VLLLLLLLLLLAPTNPSKGQPLQLHWTEASKCFMPAGVGVGASRSSGVSQVQ
jgi:hypothetical protein